MAALEISALADKNDVEVPTHFGKFSESIDSLFAEFEPAFVAHEIERGVVILEFSVVLLEFGKELLRRRKFPGIFIDLLSFQKARIEPHGDHQKRRFAGHFTLFHVHD